MGVCVSYNSDGLIALRGSSEPEKGLGARV